VLSCSRVVMGAKMTEDLRGMAQFFTKAFPPDVNKRHIKRVKPQVYYTHRFSAILGGVCKSSQEILDKILLANSLLDNAKQIFLVGEVGIAALFALGIKIGRVERRRSADLQFKDYAKLTPFFKRLFEKAIIKGVNLVLPFDVMTAPKYLPKGYVEKSSD
jgi:3-phosphoglycerate kinase